MNIIVTVLVKIILSQIPTIRNCVRYTQLSTEFNEYLEYARTNNVKKTLKYTCLVRKENKISRLMWWKNNQNNWPLLKSLAIKLFSLCCSSSMTERSFSDQAFFHTKFKNRLGLDKVQDLTFIRENVQKLNGNGTKVYCDDSDSEDYKDDDEPDSVDDNDAIIS